MDATRPPISNAHLCAFLGASLRRKNLDNLRRGLSALQGLDKAVLADLAGELRQQAHVVLGKALVIGYAEQEEQVHFIAAADNPVADCSWKLSEISQNEFVLTEQAMSYRKILNETLASQSLEIRPVLEIGNPLQICELVKNSSLLSFLPDFISEKYVKDGQIKRLDVAGCPVTVWTQLLLHKNKWRSPAINVFIEFYKEVMQR